MFQYWILLIGAILFVKHVEAQEDPWNFHMVIKYDSYVWDCSPSTTNSSEKNTKMSCILSGRWSLNNLSFQLTAIPTDGITSITGQYIMKDGNERLVEFTANSEWTVTVPVDSNSSPGEWNINDKLSFEYNGFNYVYLFGYGPIPVCPRC